MPDMFSDENIKLETHTHTHTHIYSQTYTGMCIYIHWQKLLGKKVTNKFQTTLPHIHTQKKSLRHTLTHT